MRLFVFVLILIMLSGGALADGLSKTITSDSAVVPGQIVPITIKMTNTYAPVGNIDIVFAVTARTGNMEPVTENITLAFNYTRPITIEKLPFNLSDKFTLVAGSVMMDTTPVTVIDENGIPTLQLNKKLMESEYTTISFRLLSQ